MTWSEYIVTFVAVPRNPETRYVRAVSEADAKWRFKRKYILPRNAVIIGVERV